jgi:non-ribosomal peptide synthetase component F
MACEEQLLDARLLAPLHAVRRDAKVAFSAGLLAALRLALRAVAGLDELCVGMPVSLRNATAQETAIGYFVNLVVFRDRIADGSTSVAVLNQMQRSLTETLCHRAAPLPDLARQLRPTLLPSGNPWCDIVFAYHNLPGELPRFAGVEATLEPVTLPSQYPLKVEFIPVGDACRCRIEYACRLMSAEDACALHAAIRHQLVSLGEAARSS